MTMKQILLSLPLLALLLFLAACREDPPVSLGTDNPPGTLKITRGLLVTMGINGIGEMDTLVFRVGKNGGMDITSYDWTVLDDHDGFVKYDYDIWHLELTGSGTDIHRIVRPVDNAPMFRWNVDFDSQKQKEYYFLMTTKDVSDSTDFHIHSLSNGHFTIEPVSLPGYYLNVQHSYAQGRSTEFIQGQPQEFWFQPWE
jgi:hypothetical protein